MKKKTISYRLASILVACLCLFSVFVFVPQTAMAAYPEVELYYAKTGNNLVFERGDVKQCFYIEGDVAIDNIAYDKIVRLHYSQAGGAWQTVDASYVRTAPDGKEVWHFISTPTVGRVNGSPTSYNTHWDFAIEYQVNGSTYWDNNSGNNYYLSFTMGGTDPVPYVLKKSALILDHKYKNDISFDGQIVLKNLAFNKEVVVRYSIDDWATYSETSAGYTYSMENDLEVWTFNQAAPAGSTVKFAIRYTVNGITYWDNNFGVNYTVQ